jgi:hypothetical protein
MTSNRYKVRTNKFKSCINEDKLILVLIKDINYYKVDDKYWVITLSQFMRLKYIILSVDCNPVTL